MKISDEQIVNLKNVSGKNTERPNQTKPHEKSDFYETNYFEWLAPEFIKYEKDRNWFIAGSIILAALLFVSIFTKSYIMGITFFLIGVVTFIYAKKEPKIIQFSLNHRGIRIGNRLYDFEDLKSFWIFYDPPEIKEVCFRSRKLFMTHVRIPLGDEDPTKIREFLKRFLVEKKQEESLADILARRIGF